MIFDLLDYDLFKIKNLGFGFGFLIFSLLSALNILYTEVEDNQYQPKKYSIKYWAFNLIGGLILALFGAVLYVIIKFIGFGIWQLVQIILDFVLIPFWDFICYMIDSLYNYKKK